MKKIFLLLILFFILCGCKTPPNEKAIVSLDIIQLPNKLTYYENEELDLTGLNVEATYDNNEVITVGDYSVEYNEFNIGKNTIYIKYDNLSTSFEIEVVEKTVVNISIITLPTKLIYYENEKLDFSDLVVQIQYNNSDQVIIDDYKIEYEELKVGKNTIYVKYANVSSTFEIEIIQKEKIKIDDYLDYSDKTLKNIKFSDFDNKYENVEYGRTRDTNMLIIYDETYFVKTNVYGYEVAIDKYGVVVEKGVNVTLPAGGMVLSGHGTSITKVKEIDLGDIVVYFDKTVYVYKNLVEGKYHTVFSMFHDYLEYIDTITDVDVYNEYALKINQIIPLLNAFYNEYDLNVSKQLINQLNLDGINSDDKENIDHRYSYYDIDYADLELINNSNFDYQSVITYTGKLYIGGFRNANTLVYYDKSCYVSRNNYGFEVGVNKQGIVVSKDTLVDLEEDGFILSGHGSGATFLINNVEIYDKVEIKDGQLFIYRDYKKMLANYYSNMRNELINEIKKEFALEIPHDYEYINELVNIIDSLIIELNENSSDVSSMMNVLDISNSLNKYIAICYAQLVEYDASLSRGIWYYPFINSNIYDDTTKDGVIKTIETYKEMGVNEIIIYVFAENRCLFDSAMYKRYEKLDNYNYGEYGNDYLKCFIEECHKRDIIVNAFTQTFHAYISAMKTPNEDYFQINFQGEKSLGNIHYYDICNDNLQNEVINWYSELVTKYDFDKIEYDIIRYPASNVYANINKDIIAESQIQDHGYTEYSMNKFLKQYNLTGDLRNLILTDKNVRKLWLEFKEQELIKFITNCTAKMKEIDPNVVISAAVLNGYESAKHTYLQDYRKWLELGIIDEFEVMAYTPSTNELISTINEFDDLYGNYNIRMGLSPRLDDRNLITDLQQVYYASKKDGYIMFASTLYYDDLFANILSNNHHLPFLNSTASKDDILDYEIKDAIDMIKNYYSILNNESYDNLIKQLELGEGYLELINNLKDSEMKDYLLKKIS